MATVNKDFKIKQGLVVEGTTATVNNYEVLTKKPDDQTYIIGLIGGSATPDATADTVVLRDENADFSANAITVNTLNIGEASSITDDAGDLVITVDSVAGDDFIVNADDIRLNADDDVILNATGSVTVTGTNDITLQSDNVYVGTNLNFVDSERVASQGYVDQAKSDAVSIANSDTDTKLADYTTTANLDTTVGGYGYIKNADLNGYALETYVDQAELDAVATANGYTDDEITSLDASLKTYADQAETDAKAYTDTRETAITTAYQSYADTAETDAVATANAYTDTEIAALVNGAPALLDTLNELATALENNPDVIADLRDIADDKQNTLTAGDNISIISDTISVTGLDTDDVAEGSNLYFSDSRAVDAVADVLGTGIVFSSEDAGNVFHIDENYLSTEITDGARSAVSVEFGGTPLTYDSATGVFGIELAADNSIGLDGSNGLKVNRDTVDSWYDAAGDAADALQEAKDYADALTTDDVAEGAMSQYFTDTRAKTSAAALLTGATLDNITITGDENGLTITAENGVAGSDTDDLTEGSTNLYFTDQRAVDALEAVVPNFTAIEIDEVAKHVATEASIVTASTNNAVVWAQADYKTAEFLVNINDGTDTQVSKVILTISAGDNVAITEYAIVGTASGSLGSASATVTGSTVALTVTTVNNNSDVRVVGTLLK